MGKVIKEQRMLRKMTQEQVAYALNVSAVTVGRWENNYKTPSLEHMVGLAVLFGVSLNTIAGLREEAVLSIDRLSESQRQLMIDIAHELSNPEKSKGLSRAKEETGYYGASDSGADYDSEYAGAGVSVPQKRIGPYTASNECAERADHCFYKMICLRKRTHCGIIHKVHILLCTKDKMPLCGRGTRLWAHNTERQRRAGTARRPAVRPGTERPGRVKTHIRGEERRNFP